MNATDTQVAGVSATPTTPRTLVKAWAAGTGIAVVLVAAAYLLAEAISGPLVVEGLGAVSLDNVVGLTLFGGAVGATLAYVIGRLSRRPRATFVVVSAIALAAYAVVPFTAAGTTSTAIWLNGFHIVVAVPMVGMLVRYLPRTRPRGTA